MMVYQPGVTLEAVEKQWILGAFRFHGGNKTNTARALGISIRTLDNKLNSYQEKKDDGLQVKAEGGATTHENGNQAKSGQRLQSSFEVGSQHTVPMPKRDEVQNLLPKKPASGGNGKGSKQVRTGN